MAKVTVENAEVVKHLGTKGYVIQVEYTTRNNEQRKDSWTVWGDQPDLGAVVTVTGNITIKLDEWTNAEGQTRQTARGHINNPNVVYSPVQRDPGLTMQPDLTIDPEIPF